MPLVLTRATTPAAMASPLQLGQNCRWPIGVATDSSGKRHRGHDACSELTIWLSTNSLLGLRRYARGMSEAFAVGVVSESDYLAFEESADERHEFIDGVIVAMSGASKRHNEIALSLAVELRQHARTQGCRTFIESVRLRISELTYLYPDVIVDCSDNDDAYAVSAPCLVAEVLSPSTSWIDHGRKRTAYLSIPSLREYLLLNPVEKTVEQFSRADADSDWTLRIVTETDVLRLRCPKSEISVGILFQEIS